MSEKCCITENNAVVIPDVFRKMFKDNVEIYLEENSIILNPL